MPENEPIRTYLKIFLIYGWFCLIIAILFFGWYKFSNASELIIDNFDSYTLNATIVGQGSWFGDAGDGIIRDTQFLSGPQSVSLGSSAPTKIWQLKSSTYTNGDTLRFWVYASGTSNGGWIGSVSANQSTSETRVLAFCTDSATTYGLRINMASETENCGTNPGTTIYSGLTKETWNEIVLTFTGTNESFTVSVNESVESTEATENFSPTDIGLHMASSGSSPMWFDDLGIGGNEDTKTRIQWVAPTTDTASSTFDIDYEYYINSNDFDSSNWTHILGQVCPLSYTENADCIKVFNTPTVIDSLESGSMEITAVREGYSLGLVSLWNGVLEDEDCAWWNIFCQEESVEIGVTDSQNFNVATTTISADVPTWILDFNCADSFTGVIDGTLCNVALFLFQPSESAVNRFMSLQQTMTTKVPFGFFFLVKEKIDGIEVLGSAETDDVIVDVGWGSTTLFGFTGAKETFEDLGLGSENATDVIRWILWIAIGFVLIRQIYRILKAPSLEQV